MTESAATAPRPDSVTEARAADLQAPAAPISALLEGLSARKVRYCHWKSNMRVRRALAGWGDLDLLIDREDADRFFAALADAGFRMAQSRAGLGHPGIVHAFALDPHGPSLIHVHAYFQLLTGNRLVKPYHLPFEARLLDCRDCHEGVLVPDAEIELVIFLLRIALKHASPVEAVLVNRDYASRVEELAWLRERADEAAARAIWQENTPGPVDDTFDRLLHALGDPAAVRQRVALGLRLAWRLRAWRRLGRAAGVSSWLWRFIFLAWCRIRGGRPKTLVSGGAILAVVGPKGSGKSTLGAALAECFGRKLEVRRVHVGRSSPTLLSGPVRPFLPLLRRLLPTERSSEYQKAERRQAGQFSLAYVVRMVMLAYDRRALLLRCHRLRAAGAIVIADRYPSTRVGAIDGTQFDDAAMANCRSRLKRYLMRLERRLYHQLPRPNLVVRLQAPIETTIARDAQRLKRGGPDPEAVRRRREIESVTEFAGVPEVLVNTDGAYESARAEVLRNAWRYL